MDTNLSVKQKIGIESLPLLQRFAGRSGKHLDGAVQAISAGLNADSIRNVVFQDAKAHLSRAVYDAWRAYVSDPFFYAGRWEEQPEAVQALYHSISVNGLHDVIAASKKLAKTQASGPAVDAMRNFCAEVRPLADAVAVLKGKIVKGRLPAAATPSENPNKVIMTCPVCFRPIAVVRGRMAHHGYRRPGHGWQTSSCQGTRFQPLEVSSEGLEWLIAATQERQTVCKRNLANQASHPEFLTVKRSAVERPEKIGRDDPRWPKAFKRHIAELQSEIASLERELPSLEQKLIEWKPRSAA